MERRRRRSAGQLSPFAERTPSRFTSTEKCEAAEREIAKRRRVYDALVDAKRMSREFADRQIALMEEIADDYRERAKTEKLL